ncbi:hypothetical protein GWI34_40915, partial [Actinomadura sp. DSM 109109]|nr:hypothetical protein [Actinomadura lepetitiana]
VGRALHDRAAGAATTHGATPEDAAGAGAATGAGVAGEQIASGATADRTAGAAEHGGAPSHGRQGTGAARGPSAELTLAVGCITLGILVLVRWSVPFFPDRLVWPAAIAALGAGLVLTRVGEQDRARWAEAASRLPGNPVEVLRGGRALWLRIVVGTGLLM